MKRKNKGWIIISINRPDNNDLIFPHTFQPTKKECIKKFIGGSNQNWNHWKTKFNYRCVKASQILKQIKK